MRAFVVSIVAAVAVAAGAMYLLDAYLQHPANQAFTSASNSVRIPDHGNTHNLVGKDWFSAKDHGWERDEVPTSNAPGPATN